MPPRRGLLHHWDQVVIPVNHGAVFPNIGRAELERIGEHAPIRPEKCLTREDLERRSEMHRVWASAHLGFMGRAPDYLNVNVMAAGMAPAYFAQCRPEFGENIANYFEHVREHDLCLTHALTNPQVNRAKRDSELDDPYIALAYDALGRRIQKKV